jgi:hypothetical protein
MLVPEKKLGVFVLSNLRPSFFPEVVCKSALDHLLALPSEDWVTFHKDFYALMQFNIVNTRIKRATTRKADTKPSLELKAFAGYYRDPAYGRAEVTVEDGKLKLEWGKYAFRLEHFHFDTYTAIPIAPKDEVISFDRSTFEVQFRLAADGAIEGMKFLEQEFKKVSK